MRVTLSAVAVATILCTSLVAQDPAPAAPDSSLELSKETREALDDKFEKLDGFKDWRLATVDPQRAACRTDASASPVLVTGDFNGDGRPDQALLIQGADRVQLVAVFGRVGELMVQDVDPEAIGTTAADGFLTVKKRGSSFVDAGTKLQDYYGNDTLVVQRCGQPSTAYLWMGAVFNKIVLPN